MKVTAKVLTLGFAAVLLQGCGADPMGQSGEATIAGEEGTPNGAPAGDVVLLNEVLTDIGYHVILPTLSLIHI